MRPQFLDGTVGSQIFRTRRHRLGSAAVERSECPVVVEAAAVLPSEKRLRAETVRNDHLVTVQVDALASRQCVLRCPDHDRHGGSPRSDRSADRLVRLPEQQHAAIRNNPASCNPSEFKGILFILCRHRGS